MGGMSVEERVELARRHLSHNTLLLGDWQPLGADYPLLNEYLGACLFTLVMGALLYFLVTGLSYLVLFVWGRHKFTPRRQELIYDREQYWFDIKWSLVNIVGQVPLVVLIKMGYPYFSKVEYEFNWRPAMLLYIFLHVVYDEFLTYWFHRLLHHPVLYRAFHRIHHASKTVTPFTGFAFHPLDAFAQAVPVLTSCYFLPLPIDLVLGHTFVTSLWAVSIHDNVNLIPFKGILYAGSHSIHHFPWGENYNYGKFTSVCDRLYGTYCDPADISGYGYQPPALLSSLMGALNRCYTRLVPDLGLKTVSRVR